MDSNTQNNGITGFGPQHMLSEDSKDEVQRLIARTNATQPGNAPNLMTPSDMLNTQQVCYTVSFKTFLINVVDFYCQLTIKF